MRLVDSHGLHRAAGVSWGQATSLSLYLAHDRIKVSPPLSQSQDPTEPADPCPPPSHSKLNQTTPFPQPASFSISFSRHHCPPIHSTISLRTSLAAPLHP